MKQVYDQIKSLGPYHPVSLVLNCQNFYYEVYTSRADLVFEDSFPIAINATWLNPWGAPRNLTYGDCGCENCIGELEDVSDRLDDIQNYQANLPGQSSKLTWAVLQTFGEQDYWKPIPSPAEVENMLMLAVIQLRRVFRTGDIRDQCGKRHIGRRLPVKICSEFSIWDERDQMAIGRGWTT